MMDKQLYSVIDNNGNHIAYHMELRHALILIQALMLEYYNEPNLTYRIMREQSGCEDVSKERKKDTFYPGFCPVCEMFNVDENYCRKCTYDPSVCVWPSSYQKNTKLLKKE